MEQILIKMKKLQLWLLKYTLSLYNRAPHTASHTYREQPPLTRRGLHFIPPRRSVVFLEKSVCCHVVVGAEVGADAVAQFGDGSASQVQGRLAGRLYFMMVAGSTVVVWVFCIQELFSEI